MSFKNSVKLFHKLTGFADTTSADHCYLYDPVGRALGARVLRDGGHVLDETHFDKRKTLSKAYDDKLRRKIHRHRKSNVRIEVSRRHTSKCCLSIIKSVIFSKLLLADLTKTVTWFTESRRELGFIYTATDALDSDWLLQTAVTFLRPAHSFTCMRELFITEKRERTPVN